MKLITKLKSKAKINLFLHVNGVYDDGYHELESLFYFPEIFDEIEVYEGEKSGLEISGRFSNSLKQYSIEENLIMVVYNSLKAAFPKIPNLYFKLKKQLPVSAGVGGGSGNAAVVLDFLNHNYNLGLDEFQLIDIAKRIGADVPASLFQKPCVVSGIGEKINLDIKIPELTILLVNPNKPVSTKYIFEKGFKEYNKKLGGVQFGGGDVKKLTEYLVSNTENKLQNKAIEYCPEILDLINIVSAQDGCLLSRMSGSGGTVFGIFEDQKYLNFAKDSISKSNPEFSII